jgi:SAM-dependent methyltransferase
MMSIELDIPSIAGFPGFMRTIELIRKDLSQASWHEYCREKDRLAGWREFLFADPYTYRAFSKPRGYPGDAALMDFTYRHPSIFQHIASASEIGQHIYRFTSASKQSDSARRRLSLVAEHIRVAALLKKRIRVISLASGHCRELESLYDINEKIEDIALYDGDSASMDEAISAYGSIFHLSPHKGNILRLKPSDLKVADVVYSMGLFDYLDGRLAKKMIQTMAKAVAPGGTLIIGNLMPDAANLAYCESVMDWWMIPRSHEDMIDLGRALVPGCEWNCQVIKEGCFSYLMANRM